MRMRREDLAYRKEWSSGLSDDHTYVCEGLAFADYGAHIINKKE
jgi:hypothetical protein